MLKIAARREKFSNCSSCLLLNLPRGRKKCGRARISKEESKELNEIQEELANLKSGKPEVEKEEDQNVAGRLKKMKPKAQDTCPQLKLENVQTRPPKGSKFQGRRARDSGEAKRINPANSRGKQQKKDTKARAIKPKGRGGSCNRGNEGIKNFRNESARVGR